MDFPKEYWILLDNKEILAVFQTVQECLCWQPQTPLSSPSILRVKEKDDGSFTKQVIAVNPDVYSKKFEQNPS